MEAKVYAFQAIVGFTLNTRDELHRQLVHRDRTGIYMQRCPRHNPDGQRS